MIGRFFERSGIARARAAVLRSVPALVLGAALVAGAFGAAALAAEAPARIDEASKRALDDRAIQKTLPGLAGGTSQRRQPDQRVEPPRRPQPPPRLPERSTTSGLGDIGQTILWAIAIVAGLALLYFVARELLALRRGTGRKRFEQAEATVHVQDGEGDEAGAPASLLDQADELAARGAFGEAIHLILMHSLGRIEAVSERAFGRSLTAREILRGSPITERAREFLRAIVGASELAHFGGRPAAEADYRSCREAFQRFAAETGEAA